MTIQTAKGRASWQWEEQLSVLSPFVVNFVSKNLVLSSPEPLACGELL